MKIEYFDIPIDFNGHGVECELPLPMRFLHFEYVDGSARIHYMLSPSAKEEIAKFWFVEADQELPDTFPGKYLASISEPGPVKHCGTVHIFIKTPGSGPRKPHVVHINKDEGADNGDD